jgi:hypothetical protein
MLRYNMLVCVKCDFKCTQKGDWTRHIARKKHVDSHCETATLLSPSHFKSTK